MRKGVIGSSIGLLAVGFLLVWTGAALAYPVYQTWNGNDPNNDNCSVCHPGFMNKGALHDVHVNAFTNNCNLCHPSGPGSVPVSTFSPGDATALSCLGCHGRDYGGTIGPQSAGLRLKHPPLCASCHPSDPAPLGENIAPPHYTRGDVSLTDSCADNLDNDGDAAYDSADGDCTTPIVPKTWGAIKELYQ